MPTPARAPVRFALVLVLALGIRGLAGCTGDVDSTPLDGPAGAKPTYGGTFQLMIEPPGTFDPSLVDDVYESCIINQIYDGLLEFDVHLNPVPAIAREWTVSRDGLEYVFRLRNDVRFHNGRPVVARDFVYSLTRIFDPSRDDFGIAGPFLRKIDGVEDFVARRAASIRGLDAPDDTTLVVRLAAPYSSFLCALAMDQAKVVAREEIEGRGADYDRHPVGTGPFLWREAVDLGEDPRIVLDANPDFRSGRPYLDRLVFHTPRDYDVDMGAQALVEGRVTLCDLPAAWRQRVASDPRFIVVQRPELSFSFLGFGTRHTPFDDVRLRQAVAHAIDRKRIAGVDPSGRIEAVGILPPGMLGYSPEEKALTYDPEMAGRLLADAGYPGGRGLPPLEYHQANRGEAGRASDAILRENLAAVGIRVDFRFPGWDTFSEDIDGHRAPAFGLSWVADLPDPDTFLASLFLSGSPYNMFDYSNPAVDSLLAAGARARGGAERSELYREAERRILDDAPVIPLYNIENTFAVRADVHGLLITPFGLGNLCTERIWLAPPTS